MTDDFRIPSEHEKNKNFSEDDPNKFSEQTKPGQVDSLIDNNIGAITMGSAKNKRRPIKKKIHNFMSKGLEMWPSTKRQKIIGSSAAAAILILGTGGVYALHKFFDKPQPTEQPVIVKQEPPRTTEPSNLTGVEVPLAMNKRQVTSIMIENSPDARPQAGLYDAGIVFEAIAEGGITRFNALFQETQPEYIGPVRSVRPYYVDLFMPFHASIVHAGGSAEGLAKVRRVHAKDIDHGANADAFQRVSDRYAPHNLYTSMEALDKVNKRRKYKVSKFESFPRKKDSPAAKANAANIDFNISGPLYNVHYDYDSKSNSYKRVMAGRPHTDHKSGKQITPKVVIALIMDYSQNGIYSVYKTTGKGQMFVFQDGKVQKGTWKKSGTKGQFKFTDSKGKALKLNAGQTWFTLLGGADRVSYKP